MAQLVRGVEGVHGHAHPAGRGGAVEGDRVLGQVGHVDPEHVALAEPARGEAGGERPNSQRELRVGDGPPRWPVDQRRLVPVLAGSLEDERGHVRVRDLDVVVGAPVDHRGEDYDAGASREPQVLGAGLEAVPHLAGQLGQELLAVGRVGEHRDREVEAREGGEPGGDPEQLGGQLEPLAEEIEGQDLVAGRADPLDPDRLLDREQAEGGEERAHHEADDQHLKRLADEHHEADVEPLTATRAARRRGRPRARAPAPHAGSAPRGTRCRGRRRGRGSSRRSRR